MVLFCPNIGLLSTSVLSIIPLIRPFAWQSLLMPVLPALDQMLDLMDAPVPFILGVQVFFQLGYGFPLSTGYFKNVEYLQQTIDSVLLHLAERSIRFI